MNDGGLFDRRMSELAFNPKGFVRKAAFVGAGVLGLVALSRLRRSRRLR